jgi:hypothetical protein
MYTKYYYEMSGAHNKLVEMINNNSDEWIKPFFVKKMVNPWQAAGRQTVII